MPNAVEKLDNVADRVAEAAETVTQAGTRAADEVTEVAENFADAMLLSLRKHPLPTLVGVLACGVVVGALWKV